MRTLSGLLFLSLILLSFTLFAAEPKQAKQQDTMRSGTQQQIMTQERLRDMSQVMTHMNTMLQDLTKAMEQDRTMDQTRQRDMSQLMEHISTTMHEMAQNVHKGQWTEKEQAKVQEQVKNMNAMLEKIQ